MNSGAATQRERRRTGVPGLDEISHGGLLSDALYIFRGTPGAGKTIMANQICYTRAEQGEHCLYLTLLSESHDRLLANIQTLDFYSPGLAEKIHYLSSFYTLAEEGLKGIMRLLAAGMKQYNASVVVLDGLFALQQEKFEGDYGFGLFLNELENFARLTGSTVFMLTNSERSPDSPEYTMVDGWLELAVQAQDYRVSRYLQIHKLRGTGFVDGQHTLTISDAGARVLPRLESVETRNRNAQAHGGRLATGVSEFDTMLGGGLRTGTNTLVVGPTGVGKTAFGLNFISQSSSEEAGLIFGFCESEAELVNKAEALGIVKLANGLSSGAIQVIGRAPAEHALDELGYQLIDAVRRRRVKRLFVDGVDAMRISALHPSRFSLFLSALTQLLRNEGVTAVFTLETPELVGGETKMQLSAVSTLAENIVLLRYVQFESNMCRAISIVKCRSSHFDAHVREFTLTEDGIQVGEPIASTGKVARAECTGPRSWEASESDE